MVSREEENMKDGPCSVCCGLARQFCQLVQTLRTVLLCLSARSFLFKHIIRS